MLSGAAYYWLEAYNPHIYSFDAINSNRLEQLFRLYNYVFGESDILLTERVNHESVMCLLCLAEHSSVAMPWHIKVY